MKWLTKRVRWRDRFLHPCPLRQLLEGPAGSQKRQGYDYHCLHPHIAGETLEGDIF